MKKRIIDFLKRLSFRTGVIVLCCCVAFYLISFIVLILPLPSLGWRGALWTIFFGLAKAAQYSGLIILGKEGWKRLRKRLKRKSSEIYDPET